jgi:hypothetical protein
LRRRGGELPEESILTALSLNLSSASEYVWQRHILAGVQKNLLEMKADRDEPRQCRHQWRS